MPLYSIRRNIGPTSRDEIEAAGFRAIVCASEYPGLRWIRSFWHEDGQFLTCYYIADSPDQIRQHAHQSNIPCDEIVEVTEILPELVPGAPEREPAAAS
jgi:hypothetical protein